MPELILKGGHLVTTTGVIETDVLIRDGVVAGIESGITSSAAIELDCSGCFVSPGLVDLHTHTREPGREEAETIESATRAAVLGGYTAIVAMPNTEPAIDNEEMVRFVRRQAEDTALCEVMVSAAITMGRDGAELVDMVGLAAAGVKIFTDDGSGVQDSKLMRFALRMAKELDVLVAQHCEDSVLANNGVMNAGEVAKRLAVTGQPSEAEEVMVMRDIALAREMGARIHFLHMSTAKSVAMVREAKRHGVLVTAEATPHHFSLTDEMLSGMNPLFKVNPPLRREMDRVSVLNGLRDGTIDAIATDHAPHTPALKGKSLFDAPPGMLGLETALSLAISHLGMNAPELAQVMSTNPARIARLGETQGEIAVGRPANIAVVDPEAQWVVEPEQLASKAKNTPYGGQKLTGKVRHTIVKGLPVVVDGAAQR